MRSSRGRHAAFPRSLSGFLSMAFQCMLSALRVPRQFSSWRTRDAFAQKMRRYETSNDARHKGGEISGIPSTWITKHTVKLNCVFYTESQHSSYDSIRRTKSRTKVTSVHPGLHLFISPVFKTGRHIYRVSRTFDRPPLLRILCLATERWIRARFRAAQRYKISFSNIAAKMSASETLIRNVATTLT
jgi:hypothetical protein